MSLSKSAQPIPKPYESLHLAIMKNHKSDNKSRNYGTSINFKRGMARAGSGGRASLKIMDFLFFGLAFSIHFHLDFTFWLFITASEKIHKANASKSAQPIPKPYESIPLAIMKNPKVITKVKITETQKFWEGGGQCRGREGGEGFPEINYVPFFGLDLFYLFSLLLHFLAFHICLGIDSWGQHQSQRNPSQSLPSLFLWQLWKTNKW